MRIGIDTNVLFYAIDRDSPFHEESRQALEKLVKEQVAVITQQNLVELLVALTKSGLSLEEAFGIANNYREIMPVLKPVSETLEIFFEKAKAANLKAARLFDVFLAATFLSNGVKFLYTYNEKDFKHIKGLKLWKPT